MPGFDLSLDIIDEGAIARSVRHLGEARVRLPTFAQLADPQTIPAGIAAALEGVDRDAPDPLNLFRVHWQNGADGRYCEIPEAIVLPEALTGVAAPIVLVLADRFPLIHSHKVLAAYACLIPRLTTGAFDPTRDRALWPSTGNYCRGGVAISRILGCRGVAILPEGMSEERFRWLCQWVQHSEDIVRTPGTESNVKEIYDRCEVLARDPRHVVLNQFSEFANHVIHQHATGLALARVFEFLLAKNGELRMRAFVSATGSAGTIGAGDALKERYGAAIVAAEPLECPTMLYNGFGEHNIQGIGDKHIPLIHNVTNTDMVAAVSDRHTDALNLLFGSDAGLRYLTSERRVPTETIAAISSLGLSSICNLLAARKVALRLRLGKNDVIVSVATDGAELYHSERERYRLRHYPDGFSSHDAAKVFAEAMLEAKDDHLLELTDRDRDRIFNLGYFTWVEQRGVSIEDFEARRSQEFWRGLRRALSVWDRRIEELNERTGVEI